MSWLKAFIVTCARCHRPFTLWALGLSADERAAVRCDDCAKAERSARPAADANEEAA